MPLPPTPPGELMSKQHILELFSAALILILLSVPSFSAGEKLLVGATTDKGNVQEIAQDPTFYIAIASYYVKQQNYLLAERLFAYAVTLDPKNERSLSNLAIVSHINKDYETAIPTLETLINQYPNKATYHYDLAINLADQVRAGRAPFSQIDRAINEFSEANRLEPGYLYAKENIAALTQIKLQN